MTKTSGKYYFACGFLWWLLHGFFRLLDEIEDDYLEEKLEECDLKFEEVSEWLLEEMRKPGLAFRMQDKAVSIHPCIQSYEEKIIGWFIDLETAAKKKFQNLETQYNYLYYLECGWLLHMLVVFDDFVKSLDDTESINSYSRVSNRFNELSNWLQDEISSCANDFSEESKLELYEIDKRKLYDQLTSKWISSVTSATQQFL
jgi:hypothetical protein